jgi:DNA-binding response OmpR family regulator
VEDDEAIATGLLEKLRLIGYHALLAVDGERAREIIADEALDLVILDLMLPKLDDSPYCAGSGDKE